MKEGKLILSIFYSIHFPRYLRIAFSLRCQGCVLVLGGESLLAMDDVDLELDDGTGAGDTCYPGGESQRLN